MTTVSSPSAFLQQPNPDADIEPSISPEPLQQETLVDNLTNLDLSSNGTKATTSTSNENASAETTKDLSDDKKSSKPFEFGNGYLTPEMTGFEFNAWDHVETDDDFKQYAEQQYAFQREHAVSEFDKKRFNDQPDKWWNKFYQNNKENFFKDRKWLQQEFPILRDAISPDSSPVKILEVGCGAGNTLFPLLSANKNPNFHIHGSDFSKTSIDLITSNPLYAEHHPQHISASVWDLGNGENALPEGVEEHSIDVVILIFVFSALHPSQWPNAMTNIRRCLKKGGKVLFRDYGRGDLAQVRFKKGRLLQDNFYIRGDGTRVYFFEEDELRTIFGGGEEKSALNVLRIGVDRRMLVNRARQLKMYRCWVQGFFVKGNDGDVEEAMEMVTRQGWLPIWMRESVERPAGVQVEVEVEDGSSDNQ